MLLHDTGKGGVGGQEKAGARSARAGLRAPGRGARTKVELVAWLVENHLVMSDFAQKRDVADPGTVAAFAQHRREPRAPAPAAGDHRGRHPRRGAWRLERLEGPAAARTLQRHRGGVPGRARQRRRRQRPAPPGGRRRRPRAVLVQADPAAKGWAQAMEAAYFGAFLAG